MAYSARLKLPPPEFRNTETVFPPVLATATSRSRSPSKSPPASATGPLPVAYEAPLVNALPSSRLSELPAWSV